MSMRSNVLIRGLMMGLLLSTGASFAIQAQSVTNPDGNILLGKSWSAFGTLHSSGFGIGMRSGHYIDGTRLIYWEGSLENWNHPKEVRSSNPFHPAARGYKYGKLNYVFAPRISIGLQKTLNDEPYWGGIEVGYFYKLGVTAAITKPVYLIVLTYISDPYDYIKSEAKYDPDKHFPEDIYGNGSFLRGFDEMKFYPGIHAKGGFNFEYGEFDEDLRAVEIGISLDVYPRPVPVMAFNPGNYTMLTLFINYQLGKRSY